MRFEYGEPVRKRGLRARRHHRAWLALALALAAWPALSRAATWTPIDLGDGVWSFVQSNAIRGNVGVSGATVSAGGISVVSGPGGNFVIEGLSGGTYTVTVSRPTCGFSPASRTVTLGNGDAMVTLSPDPICFSKYGDQSAFLAYYVDDYQYASGVTWNGHFRPNIHSPSHQWVPYVSQHGNGLAGDANVTNSTSQVVCGFKGNGNHIVVKAWHWVYGEGHKCRPWAAIYLSGDLSVSGEVTASCSGPDFCDIWKVESVNQKLVFKKLDGNNIGSLTFTGGKPSGSFAAPSILNYNGMRITKVVGQGMLTDTNAKLVFTHAGGTSNIKFTAVSTCWDSGYRRLCNGDCNLPLCADQSGSRFLSIAGRVDSQSQPWKLLPGEITPDSWGLLPMESTIDRTFVVNGKTYHASWFQASNGIANLAQSSNYFTNLPASDHTGPDHTCVGTCYQVAPRAVIDVWPDGHVKIFISGLFTSGNAFQDVADIFTNWMGGKDSTYDAVSQWLFVHNIPATRAEAVGHSLGNWALKNLGNMGWISKGFGLSPPILIDSAEMVDRTYVDYTFYSGDKDFVSNGLFLSFNPTRQSYLGTTNFVVGNTGNYNGFALFNPHYWQNYVQAFHSSLPAWARH